MNKGLLWTLSLVVLFTSACGKRVMSGKGEIVTEERTTGSFERIDISAPVEANVHIRPGSAATLTFSGYKNLIDELEAEVVDNTLTIDSKNDFLDFDTDRDVVAEITVGSLSDLEIHGAADATVDGVITGQDFRLKISGAGDVSIEKLEVTNLTATISGAGDVDIAGGTAENAHFKISGAGNVNAFGLVTNNLTAKVSGAGDMKVNATATLDAKVSGAGSIRYKGQPALKSETSGIGEIAAAD